MEVPAQIATVVVSQQGTHYGLFVPCLPIVCIYILLWSQGITHYSKKFPRCVVNNSETMQGIQPLPILDYSSLGFVYSLRASWKQLPAVIVRLPIVCTVVKAHLKQFEFDLNRDGRSIGLANGGGLRSGGGWPVTPFACGVRAIPEWKELYTLVAEIDGRKQTAFDIIETFEPVIIRYF